MSEHTSLPPLIEALRDPAIYPHDVESVTLEETHISWVLLTGEFAYKIKKPVDLHFLDFTSLADRKWYCEEELRLNRRFAPAWYRDVLPLFDSPAFGFTGDGEPVEYAIQMCQFDPAALLDRQLVNGRLEESHIDSLADAVATFHLQIDAAGGNSDSGSLEQVAQPQRFNLQTLREHLPDRHQKRLSELEAWCDRETDRLQPVFAQRKANEFIRECHGDLHLGNLFLTEDETPSVTLFDGIEFSESLRWIDVLSDLAFLLMDLTYRDHAAFAGRLLNRYLEHTGDYAGLQVLPFYLVYRACVRAKVAAYRLNDADAETREVSMTTCENYLQLAEQFTRSRQPTLSITHGFSGSGKSWHTQRMLDSVFTVRLRSDVERKRLHGIDRLETSVEKSEVYSASASEQTYAQLRELSRELLTAGYDVLVDATFLKRSQREPFQELAEECGVGYRILTFETDESILRERIRQRAASGNDPSEATEEVLTKQLQTYEPLTEKELSLAQHATSD